MTSPTETETLANVIPLRAGTPIIAPEVLRQARQQSLQEIGATTSKIYEAAHHVRNLALTLAQQADTLHRLKPQQWLELAAHLERSADSMMTLSAIVTQRTKEMARRD